MSEADLPALIGYLVGAWSLGWCMGYLVFLVRRVTEFI